jgi:hypothetical protein
MRFSSLSLPIVVNLAVLGSALASAAAETYATCEPFSFLQDANVRVQDNVGISLTSQPKTAPYAALWATPSQEAVLAMDPGVNGLTRLQLNGQQGQFIFRVDAIQKVSATETTGQIFYYWMNGSSACRSPLPIKGTIDSVKVLKVVYQGGVQPH